jgi:hypothetical protein
VRARAFLATRCSRIWDLLCVHLARRHLLSKTVSEIVADNNMVDLHLGCIKINSTTSPVVSSQFSITLALDPLLLGVGPRFSLLSSALEVGEARDLVEGLTYRNFSLA